MAFVSNRDYRNPPPIEARPGEPVTIGPTLITIVRDVRGFEIGYDVQPGVIGSQHPYEAAE